MFSRYLKPPRYNGSPRLRDVIGAGDRPETKGSESSWRLPSSPFLIIRTLCHVFRVMVLKIVFSQTRKSFNCYAGNNPFYAENILCGLQSKSLVSDSDWTSGGPDAWHNSNKKYLKINIFRDQVGCCDIWRTGSSNITFDSKSFITQFPTSEM